MNWHIGQEIVAIINHPDKRFKIGDTFKINGLRDSFCKCLGVEIDIGDTMTFDLNRVWCDVCNEEYIQYGSSIMWHDERDFAPLDSLMSKEIKELLTDLPQHLQNIENEKIYLETQKNYLDNGIYEDNETNDN